MNDLIITAIFLGAMHTLAGPDHYIPFVALAKVRGWSLLKTLSITFVCGIGHVMSSILIGTVGILLGTSLGMLNGIEAVRGDFAAYMLLAFGIFYIVFGLKNAFRNDREFHTHTHGADIISHSHSPNSRKKFVEAATSFWTLFLIFVFGPCEVLIPLVMAPAMEFNWLGVVTVSLVFSCATICTMMTMVSVLHFGASSLNFNPQFFRRFGHAISGACIAACAGAMILGA